MYRDALGLIVQQDGDGGDTAQRCAMYCFVKDDLCYRDMRLQLEVDLGIWCRHPTQYPDTKDLSRDQTDPNIICMGHHEDYDPLLRVFLAQLKRGFFYQNKDLPMLLTFSLFIRAFKIKWLWPLLYVFDIGFLWCWIGAIIDQNPNHVDDNNLVMRFLQAINTMPTLWSFLGRKLYTLCRPENNGNYLLREKNSIMGALAWYHRAESGGNVEIAEAYRPLIMEYFKQ